MAITMKVSKTERANKNNLQVIALESNNWRGERVNENAFPMVNGRSYWDEKGVSYVKHDIAKWFSELSAEEHVGLDALIDGGMDLETAYGVCVRIDQALNFLDLAPRVAYLETTHVGRVLEVYSRDYRAMSDVYTLATYARVANEDGTTQEILVNANFELDGGMGHAEVDATPEIRSAVATRREADERAARQAEEAHRFEMEKARKARIAELNANAEEARRGYETLKGKKVIAKVTKNKKKVTVEGILFWVGTSSSGQSVRCGVKDARGEVTWTTLSNVKAA